MIRVKQCPACRTDNVIPIEYGIPDMEMIKKHEAGEIYLGGPDDEDAKELWHCLNCELNFR